MNLDLSSVLWVISFVLLLAVALNQLLFKPLARVMAERESAVLSARRRSDDAAARARAASDEFERRTREARAEVYRHLDEARRGALDRRAKLLDETRQQAEAAIADARTQLRAETDVARRSLDRDADSLATTIVERVLGRRAS